MKITDTICSGREIRHVFSQAMEHIEADKAYVVKIKEGSTRTLEQNKKLHAVLGDISRQVAWCGKKHSVVVWKRIIGAYVRKQEFVQGIDGEMVVIGVETSSESVKFISEMIEAALAFGAEHNVFWSDPAEKARMEYPEARAR